MWKINSVANRLPSMNPPRSQANYEAHGQNSFLSEIIRKSFIDMFAGSVSVTCFTEMGKLKNSI